ncbi:MAG: crossover junction endodeoxyribonuclease RuvC [Bacteroidales bacterium]|nr:crossover junction endodeoxyribonuclease RuvC [Bacteroidales bacterium]
MKNDRIILGIDPGTNIMGYGLIHIKDNRFELLNFGVIKLSKYSNQALKLKKIFERTLSLIEEYHPDEIAIESPFYGKNIQSMHKLGRAQGVAMAAGLYRDVPIFEYSPKKVKQSITGKGSASKEQVAAILFTLLNIREKPRFLDETDALALALCHYFQKGTGENTKKASGWGQFIRENPQRVRGA